MSDAVADFVNLYKSRGLWGVPLTADQVEALESQLGLRFPASYYAYLLIAGAYPPPKLRGSDCHGLCLTQLRQWANELLQECGTSFTLPEKALVFCMHQGYQFFYFPTDGSAQDPPVYHYFEGKTAPETCSKLSEWVLTFAP